jgi:FkbM family methyltransferase
MTAIVSELARRLYLLRKTFITRSARRCYSQFGEDILLDELIEPSYPPGVFVDVGAWHPTKYSNTYFLYRRGWRGVNIDLDPIKIEAFRLARPRDINVCAAVSDGRRTVTAYTTGRYGLGSTIDPETAQREPDTGSIQSRLVETRTLDDIIGETPYAGKPIDLLCIDAEGHDWPVLQSLDLKTYRPSIVVIESSHTTIGQIVEDAPYRHLTASGYRLCGWALLSLIFRIPAGPVFRDQKSR